MTMFSGCCSNLKGFAASRPPLVVFTCCLLALAFATLYLAHYVDEAESLPDPDIPLDWNKLLTRMAGLELCVKPEKSQDSPYLKKDPPDEIISVTAALELTNELHSKLSNNTKITGFIAAKLLGIKGTHSISVSFFMVTNYTNGAHHDNTICATFTGPSSELPDTQVPPQCKVRGPVPGEKDSHLLVRARGPEAASDWCSEGTELRLAYQSNSSLTPTLTLHDRSIVNLHLMHTSYFLLVMALTLICYAVVKGKHMGHHEKVPLSP